MGISHIKLAEPNSEPERRTQNSTNRDIEGLYSRYGNYYIINSVGRRWGLQQVYEISHIKCCDYSIKRVLVLVSYYIPFCISMAFPSTIRLDSELQCVLICTEGRTHGKYSAIKL